jgi:hypothetical protein
MTGEMVVALGNTQANDATVFGHAIRANSGADLRLHHSLGREYAPEEQVQVQGGVMPQARQTFSVVGTRPDGHWGYVHGLNDQGVALGLTAPPLRLPADSAGLTGPDLIRLGLERSRSARQAVDLFIDLIERRRLAAGPDGSGHALLIADATEAFLIEAIGAQWVLHAVDRARAAGDVATVRQDWVRIVPGLASLAAGEGWWPADGSKLDFAAAFAAPETVGPARAAWQRNTDLVRQQADLGTVRKALMDAATPVCLVARLFRDSRRPVVGWFAQGPAPAPLYLPLVPAGEPPASSKFQRLLGELRVKAARDDDFAGRIFEEFQLLQERLDRDTEEWTAEAAKQANATIEWKRRAELFMQHALERAEAVVETLVGVASPLVGVR